MLADAKGCAMPSAATDLMYQRQSAQTPTINSAQGERHETAEAGQRPHVVIVGAGFAGLTTAQTLAKVAVSVTLIDRRNHHLFQPLLYQVATAGLSPAQIATPI